MREDYSREIKQLLREFSQKAQEEELRLAILKLEETLDKWHKGQIDVWEVSEHIHKYDTAIARQIYSYYRDAKPASAVTRAISQGFLNADELPHKLLQAIESLGNQ